MQSTQEGCCFLIYSFSSGSVECGVYALGLLLLWIFEKCGDAIPLRTMPLWPRDEVFEHGVLFDALTTKSVAKAFSTIRAISPVQDSFLR